MYLLNKSLSWCLKMLSSEYFCKITNFFIVVCYTFRCTCGWFFECNGVFFYVRYSEHDPVDFIVISLSPVYSIDSSAIHLLKDLIKELDLAGKQVCFSCVNERVWRSLIRSGIVEMLGEEWFHETEFDACQHCVGLIDVPKKRWSRSLTHHSDRDREKDRLNVDIFGTHH